MRLSAFCLLALILGPALLPAQMRYHFGDNPRWADPNFDDSSWPVASNNRFPLPPVGSSRVTWLRARVSVPTDPRPLAIRLPELETTIAIPNELLGQWPVRRRHGQLSAPPLDSVESANHRLRSPGRCHPGR